MHVNYFIKLSKSLWLKLLAALIILLCAIFYLAAFVPDKSEVLSKRVNIAVRAIGHDLLLRAGDFTSVLPPVIEKSDGVFLLQFENEFVFQPDTLVAIVQRFLIETELSHYTVTVQDCNRPYIVYGFEINPPSNIIIPCSGRSQPKACYNVEIAFADFPDPTARYASITVLLGGIPLVLAFILLGANFRSTKSKPLAQQNTLVEVDSKSVLVLGRFVFDTTHQCLRMDEEVISLTDKECSILMLLYRNIGRLTLRDELIQEVWTDEGVITGRSLDMFISKLRKKLSTDPDLRITNIHGKGYRLEILNNLTV